MDISDVEVGEQLTDWALTCCSTPMKQYDNVLECFTCRSSVHIGIGGYIDDILAGVQPR